MILYACASCLLGWTSMSHVAVRSLHARELDARMTLALRLCVMTLCGAGALASWLLVEGIAACLTFSFACACISAILACDLMERIIPTELVAALLTLGIAFRIALEGIVGLLAVGLPAACIAACLLALNHVRVRDGKPEPIGSGDVRMIVPLALFSGCSGIMCGIFAAALIMLAIAVLQLAMGRTSKDSGIALAPGLAAWLFAGALIPLL